MLSILLHLLILIVAWSVALSWCWRVSVAVAKFRLVPNLLRADAVIYPHREFTLTVIVPACDEAADIEECLCSLMAQDYPALRVIAVDDRSKDGTGAIMDGLAAEAGPTGRLSVIHVEELPAGWMGKTHAMALAARQATSDWILFTDGDIFYAPDALRRAVAFAEQSRADHVVVFPTPILRSWGESAMMSFFQTASLWTARPWRVPDSASKRDFIGIGAFNMIRRDVYTALGGFEELRMEVLEDIRLGFLVKRAGYAQRVAFGRGLVRVRWAAGAFGMVQVLTKNLFSIFRFRARLLLGACAWMLLFSVGPFIALFAQGRVRWAGLVAVLAIAMGYRLYAPRTGIPWFYALFHPLAALLFVYAMLRSMFITWKQGGVVWRGTFYSLKELVKNCGPLW